MLINITDLSLFIIHVATPRSPPMLVTSSNNIVDPGDTVVLACITEVDSPIIWRRTNNRPIDPSFIRGDTLVITDVQLADTGVYVCGIMDRNGNILESVGFDLTVCKSIVY